jgi:cytoskeleton protein RodZ
MNDEIDNPEKGAADAEQEGPRGGERLAAARRERQISVLEIAKELHLDEPKVRALERNDFDVLGAPVFAKGHLRKYSHLVGVDHEDVLTDYYRLTRSQSIPPVVTTRKRPMRELTPGPWIAAITVILVVAMAYWLFVMQPFATEEQVNQVPVAAPVEVATEDEALSDEANDAGDEEQAVAAIEEAQPPATQEQAAPQADIAESSLPAAVAEGDVRLSITFIGECWTEIVYATGRRLFFDMGRTGRTVNVSGQSPVSVLLGDADNVNLRVNGSDFAISDADRRGRTARLMLHSP